MLVHRFDPDQGFDSGLRAVALSHRAILLRFIRARGGANDAEDLFHDLWLKLPALPSGPIAEPLGYLFRMADNMMHDRRRAAERRTRREATWGDRESGGGTETDPTPERLLAAREELAEVERLLAGLGERTDRIFRRFRLDGATQKMIATEQGISLSAVEKHLQRAYRTIVDWRIGSASGATGAESTRRRRLASEDSDTAAP